MYSRTILLRLLPYGSSLLLRLILVYGLEWLVVVLLFKEKTRTYQLEHCYLKEPSHTISNIVSGSQNRNLVILEDILLSETKPIPGRTIFFLETKCNAFEEQYFVNLTARQACSIESAALHNSNFQVFVLFANPKIIDLQNPMIQAIQSHKNVHLRQVNIWRFVEDTPVEDWILSERKFVTNFPTEHSSDLLRLVALYRFGGIYLDMDVVVLRSLEAVPMNYVGTQITNEVSNAVISLESTGTGHQIAELFLQDLKKNFNGTDYVCNGPMVIQRVLKEICVAETIEEMINNRKRCRGMQLFDPSAFFKIQNSTYFFDAIMLKEAMIETNTSYIIHVWNRSSEKCLVKVGSNAAYGKYAERNCPRSYKVAGEYF